MDKQIRWQQRFRNLESAFLFLEEGVQKKTLDRLQEGGVIQAFEFTFELSWKTLKDFLNSEGLPVNLPRDVIKSAFQIQIIQNGHLWIEMLDKRNELSHTYDQKKATEAVQLIREHYYPGLKQVYEELKKRCLD